MEDVVQARLGRQLEAVRDGAHAFQDLERSIVARQELGRIAALDRCSRTLVEAKPRPFANLELNMAMSLVVVLHVILSLQQAFPNVSQKRVAFLELAIQGNDASHALLVGQHGRRRPTINHLERSRLEGGLVRRIVIKFRPWKPTQPATRAITCKATEVDA